MTRWLLPLLYFVLCETLDLLYELGLASQISGTIGMISAFLLIAITFPAISIGELAHKQTAILLGILPTDTIAYHSFWPRFVGVQSSILVCTLAVVLIVYFVGLGAKAVKNDA